MPNMTTLAAAKAVLYGEITSDLIQWAIDVVWENGYKQGTNTPGNTVVQVFPPEPPTWNGRPQHPMMGLQLHEIARLQAIYKNGDGFISAIKELRQMKNYSLRDAKLKIEELFKGGPIVVPEGHLQVV